MYFNYVQQMCIFVILQKSSNPINILYYKDSYVPIYVTIFFAIASLFPFPSLRTGYLENDILFLLKKIRVKNFYSFWSILI
jgi:hypothetical protein